MPQGEQDHDHDLALAAELQAALLPRGCPDDCPHQHAAARNRMTNSVGGDFYDFMRLNEDQIALIIGDVAGHGVRSSLIMAQIMGFLRSSGNKLSRPAQIATELNMMLIDLGERTELILPCSMFYGVIDSPTGMAIFVNAGHPRPWLCQRSSGTIHSLSAHNLMLGIEAFEPTEICLTFVPGDRLVLYTDGLTDAMNPRGEYFGEEKLKTAVQTRCSQSPEDAADGVFKDVEDFREGRKPLDDETIVVIDRI